MWFDRLSQFKWLGRTAMAAAIALPMLVSVPMTAEAGGWDPGAAAVVGIIGGLAIGSALADHHHRYDRYDEPYYPRGRVTYDPRRYYDDEPSCYRVRERIWVPGYGWDYRRRTICD